MTETRQPLIEVEKLEAWYGRRRILQGVDFNVNAGEIRVIMGGSGSGKSTLLRHLLGLHKPRSGTVRLLGFDIGNASEREMLANVFLWTGHFPERTRGLVRHLEERADQLGLVCAEDRERAATIAVTTLVTALAMNWIHGGTYGP